MNIPQTTLHHWFPIGKNLSNPYPFTIMGKNYVAYQDGNGQLLATDDYCPHRGYPLSQGKSHAQGIQCQYHGWEFNARGELTNIPGLEKCPKIKLKPYPTMKFNGYHWINLGNSYELSFPNLKDKAGSIHMEYTIHAPMYLVIENTLDPMHTAYVHKGLVRNNKRKDIQVNINGRDNLLEAVYLGEGKQSGVISKLFGSDDDVGVGRYIHPGIIQLEYRDSKRTKALMQAYLRPINESTTMAFIEIEYTSHPLILLKPLLALLLRRVLLQDIKIVEKQFENIENSAPFINTELDFLARPLRSLFSEEKLDYSSSVKLNI